MLNDLKLNHHVIGVKTEFETEGASFEEALRLKEIASKAELEFTVKVGGCGALKDMREAELIGVNTIVAPMIESPYAVKKYVQTLKTAFSDEKRKNIRFFINIETKYGMKYLEEILNTDSARYVDGIVFGRTDMTDSLNMSNDCADSDIIFSMAVKSAVLAKKYNKEFIIGGAVTGASVPFFKKLLKTNLSKYETRKIIFDIESLRSDNAESGIIKALEFEKLWIENKQSYSKRIFEEDKKRLEVLRARTDFCY